MRNRSTACAQRGSAFTSQDVTIAGGFAVTFASLAAAIAVLLLPRDR